MSSARLLLSGSLVASGLILGAFTLHGAFDPRGLPKQAAGRHESGPKANPFQTRTDFVAGESAAQDAPPPVVKASAKADAKPAARAKAAAARVAARRKLAEKKRIEKERAEKIAKAKQQPQQASVQWPWNWLGN